MTGYTGFVPRQQREPLDKEGGVAYDVKRPDDPRTGFTGFKPKFQEPYKEPEPVFRGKED